MWWLIIIGVVVLCITAYDILWTILSAAEAGPVSHVIMRFYKRISRMFRRNSLLSHQIVRSIGLFTFITSINVWFLLFWLGWSLIFFATPSSVVLSSDMSSTGYVEKGYFVGYMIFTAGLGDYKPIGSTYQILAVLANATGIILVTITIAYLLSATDAVTRQRQMAGHISALGNSPTSILVNAWNGKEKRLSSLNLPLNSISKEITICAQMLMRFPLIFNFHSIETDYSASIRLATFDEILTIMECAMPSEFHIDKFTMIQCRKTVDQFLMATKEAIGIHFDIEIEVPVPSLAHLEQAGIPLVSHAQWRHNMKRSHIIERRRLLYKIVSDSARQWSEVYGN